MEINVSREELQKCKLMIATPMYGGLNYGSYTRSLIELTSICKDYGVQLSVYYLSNESLITRARNYCVDSFMRSDCTHLMFIDSDIGFNANDVIALLALSLMNKKDYNIICGPYPKKNISWEKIKHAVDKGLADEDPNNLNKFVGDYVFNLKHQTAFKLDEPVEVAESGTGFMLIPRETFEKYKAAYPELMYLPDHARTADFSGDREIMCYFDCVIDRGYTFGDLKNAVVKLIDAVDNNGDINSLTNDLKVLLSKEEKASKRYLSEDYYFCYQADRIGLKTWICPWMQLSHTGTWTFEGSLAEVLMAGAHPTIDDNTVEKNRKKK